MSDICVVIPTINRSTVLINTINGVLDQSYQNFELIIVDQSQDNDEIVQFLDKINDARIKYFRVKPASVTAAKNFALKKARSPLALILDDDVKLRKDLIKNHLLAHDKHPEVSAVGGRVLQKGFPIKEEVLRFDDLAFSQGVFTATKAGFTNAFPGGNCSLKVNDALKVGGFDTRYYANGFREESDMGIKMIRAGMKIYYEPEAELTHLAEPRGGSRLKNYPDLHDTPEFYGNELFFTLRAVRPKKLIKALHQKYRVYCRGRGRKKGLKRTMYFMFGLASAFLRQVFGRQITAKEF